MSDSTSKMIWTKEAERNLIMCLWWNEASPKHKIETTKWNKITQDFARVQGQSVGTSALQTRVNLLKNNFAAATNQPAPIAESSDTQPEENRRSQFLIGAGGDPRVVATQDQNQTNLYQDTSYDPGRYLAGPYHFNPHGSHQGQMAQTDYTYANAQTHRDAVSQVDMGHAAMSMYDPRLLGGGGGNQDRTPHTYPPPPM